LQTIEGRTGKGKQNQILKKKYSDENHCKTVKKNYRVTGKFSHYDLNES
jgi:hypothetical protein